MATEITTEKRLVEVSGNCVFADTPVRGYEIHAGISTGMALARPAFAMSGQPEGAISDDNQVLGAYWHAIFDQAEACSALLRWAGLDTHGAVALAHLREASLDHIADAALPLLEALAALRPTQTTAAY